jgi:hypothetical protein
MANNLNRDLEGKYVVLNSNFKGDDIHKVFLCKDGFGVYSSTIGKAIIGEFVYDGEKCRVEGYDVERLATDEEVRKAKEIFATNNKNE